MKNIFLLSNFIFLAVSFMFFSCTQKNTIITPTKPKMTSQQALQRLIKGNERYVNNKSLNPNINEERRKEI